MTDLDQLAHDTAEYIAKSRLPEDRTRMDCMLVVRSTHTERSDKPMPTAVDEIKQALLAGECRAAWMDHRVVTALRALHGKSTSGTAA